MKTYLILFLVLLVIFAVQSFRFKKQEREKLKKALEKAWGTRADCSYRHDEYEKISHYYQKTVKKDDWFIDDITWNDISMDDIFKAINHTCSSVGEESLYRRLRILEKDAKKLRKFGEMAAVFEEQPDKARKLQEVYASIGKTRGVSLYDFLEKVSVLPLKSNLSHYLAMLALLVSFVGFFLVPQYAVFLFLAVLSWNIYSYYKEKNDVNSSFVCLKYIVCFISQGGKIKELLKEFHHPVFEEDIALMEQLLQRTASMKKGMFLISSGDVNDSIVELVMQYVRMIFHVDLVKFNALVKKTANNLSDIQEMYRIAGDVEAAICAASFRTYLKQQYGGYAIPEFTQKSEIQAQQIYHPLIANAVKNTMEKEKSVLLTGSNASGKSTYLKTIALNAILAQTIDTAAADRFVLPCTHVFSSMSLRDSLTNNDSYYMAEIKSLKRILDFAATGENVICFIDEVLRGTNTIERIAASSEILRYLKMSNVICFAATHDIELTYILEKVYENYHFAEEVNGEDVYFSYCLKKGRTVTRNAIRLLKVMGYEPEIVSGASDMVNKFAETGRWE